MKKLISVILLSFIGSMLFGQSERAVKKDTAGIKIDFQWAASDKKDPDSKKQLCLFILNSNEHFVELAFTLQFYFKGEVHEESLIQKFCLKPGKEIKGKKYGLCWISEELSNEEIEGADFKFELGDLKIEKAKDCK